MKNFLFIVALFILQIISYAQQGQQRFGGSINGKVIDAGAKEPIEYANIILFAVADSSQITGTITDKDGLFQITPIRPGNYYIDVQFISYQKKRLDNINLTRQQMNLDLGTIEIKSSSINLGDVVVEGQRSSVSYQIDKKVIDVDQMATTLSGNAADVLQNVPSVTVDIEGNVSLRGSGNFTVLVDGRPSVLDAQDVLQQVPASSIDNIEIITNPSAKYDPEGSVGIINIILKKSIASGISGISNLNAGLKDKYGGDFLIEYKTPSVNSNLGLDYNNMFFPGEGNANTWTRFNGTTSYLDYSGTGTWGRKMFGLRGSLEFILSSFDVLSLGGRFGTRNMERQNAQSYDQWSDTDPAHSYFRNLSSNTRSGSFYALNLNYQHKFELPGHELTSEFSIRRNNSEEESFTERFSSDILTSGIRSTEDGPDNDIEGKIDYTLPLEANAKFQAGYEGETEISEENTGYYEYTQQNQQYIFNDLNSHGIKTNENQHAVYSIYSGELDKFGYQGGIRAEYTYRLISVDKSGDFELDTWDYFPSFHTSYSFSESEQLMASYTRRIQRPGGWSLEPFLTWFDQNNVRIGNPSLKPEYIDSYEAGFRTLVGPVSVSTELYYRVNNNKIEEIRSVYMPDVTLTTFGNVGKDYSLGTEFMFNFGLERFWEMNLMGNLYDYRIEGKLFNEPFNRKSFNWNARFNNSIRLASGTQFQVNASYNSPSVSSQGTRESFFTTDVAVRQELFNRALAVTLQIRDIFGTAINEFTSSGPDFYSYRYMKRDSPVVMLNLRYSINNYKQEERRRPDSQGDFEGEGEF